MLITCEIDAFSIDGSLLNTDGSILNRSGSSTKQKLDRY